MGYSRDEDVLWGGEHVGGPSPGSAGEGGSPVKQSQPVP